MLKLCTINSRLLLLAWMITLHLTVKIIFYITSKSKFLLYRRIKKICSIVIVLFILFSVNLWADSFYEDPTLDLHAHPLQDIRVSSRSFARGEIVEVLRHSDRKEKGLVKAVITSGKYIRRTVFAETVSYFGGGGIKVVAGENIILSYLDGKEGPENILVDGYDRTGQVIILLTLFVAVALLVGRRAVVLPFLALIAGLFLIKLIFIPAVSGGGDPIVYALVTVSVMVLITMAAIDKLNRKAVSAICGALSGLGSLTLFSVIFYRLSDITGFHITIIQLLQYIDSPLKIKSVSYFRHLMIAVIVLGSSGIIMDVAISIASSIKEITVVSGRVKFSRLAASARDVAAQISVTMINTMIFAYIGASIGTVLVRGLQISSLTQLLNSEFFHIEFYRIVIGSVGLLICAAVTVVVGSLLLSRGVDK